MKIRFEVNGLDGFANEAEKFIGDLSDLSSEEPFESLIASLTEYLNSSEAEKFTDMMNDYYASNNIKDPDGSIRKIQCPKNIFKNVKNYSNFLILAQEDMWFRANALYGNNFLGQLGIKYIGGD